MPENSKRVAVVLAENIYENLELHYPRLRLEEAGFDVKVAAPEKGKTYTSKEGYPVVADAAFGDIDPKTVNVLIIPGGYAPDKLRRHKACLDLVSSIFNNGAVVGFICHGGWVPISAKIVSGKRLTSVEAIRDDLVNAGASWLNERVVVDGKMVTAQLPRDLPEMMKRVLEIAR